MGLSVYLRHRSLKTARTLCVFGAVAWSCVSAGWAQVRSRVQFQSQVRRGAYSRSTQRFLAGRSNESVATEMQAARQQQAALVAAQAASGGTTSLNANWQALGPNQVASLLYGNVTGRVTSIALDPADTTGNTVYLGTTGGGVWKSTNAAGPASAVRFAPLTDTLPVFSANAGGSILPSLSIGAVSVQGSVLLAGTGDPNDATDSYYGSGILRSGDGGLTWTLAQESNDGAAGQHSFVGLSVAGFAWSSPTLVVAALSDSYEAGLVSAGATNSVRGLYYSNDAGVTWKMANLWDGSQQIQMPQPAGASGIGNAVTAVVWNPVRQRFYAAVRFHGYYESVDGQNWTRLTQQPGTGLTTTACPPSPNTTGSPNCPIFRGALAVQPATGDTFALTVDANNQDQGLWQDVCASSGSGCSGTVAWGAHLDATPLEAGSGSTVIPQGDYNLALAAVASGGTSSPDTLLFVGTADLYRCSLAAGCSLRNTTNATNGCAAPAQVAGAQHALAGLATASQPLVYIGNDGGLWRSTDGVNQSGPVCSPGDASHFQNLNGGLGSLAEVVSFAQDPTDAGTLLVGLGANGSAGISGANVVAAGDAAAWPQLGAGEGGTVAIDPANPRNWYVSTAAGVSIGLCTNGSGCAAADFAGPPAIGLPQVANDASLIDPPWLLDPALTSNLMLGTCRVWRGSGDGIGWSGANAISKLLSGPQNSSCGSNNGELRSLAAGGPVSSAGAAQNAGSTVLYAGMAGTLDGGGAAGGHLFSTQAGDTVGSSSAWTDLTASPVTNALGVFNPGAFDVSSVTVDPHDATGMTVYATVMGFSQAHVYRSTDGGAHWANISGNLPNAPANSLVVDPNDANTVYVALDTGVYVTQAVGTCASTNCWSPYGLGLPNAPVMQLAAAAGMPTGDGRTGELRAGTYGRGIWQIPLLGAVSTTAPAISLSTNVLAFSDQQVNTASAAQTVTITNTGTADLTVSSATATGDFSATNNCTTVAVNATCTVQVIFLPTQQGARSGVLTIYGNVAGGQATVMLAGNGTAPGSIVLNPIAMSFPATAVGSVSAPQNVTLSNTGGSQATLGTPAVTGDFRLSANTCTGTLGPSTGCTVSILFAPTASGTRNGTLTITDSAGTQTTSLTGAGTSPATDALAPLALTFAPQTLGTASAAQTVTLTNTGDVALTLIAASIGSGDFTVVNGCGASLNAHSACSMAVTYVPKNVGNEAGTLVVADQYRSQTVVLNGTGLAPPGVSLAPLSGLSFGALGVGITSPGQTVTLTNNGGTPLPFSGFAVSGDFVILPGSNTCANPLPVYSACTVQIAFAPTAAGVRTGTLTASDEAPNAPQTLALTGTGVDFSLAASNSTVTVSSGQSAVFGLLLSSASGVPGAATFTCSGQPVNSTCLVVPNTVPLGTGTATVTVTVETGVSTTSSTSAASRMVWFALMLPLGLWGWRRSRWPLAAMLVLCGLIAATGCGSSRLIPSDGTTSTGPSSPTPSGNSIIVVSATSAGLVRTVNLNLIVK